MLKVLRNAWKIEDLRKKMLFTLFIVVLFRIGSVFVTVPFLDASVLKEFFAQNSSTVFGFFNTLSGGSFSNATLFTLSVQPYINASIIMNLLTIAIPALERLNKEGEEGRKKIGQYTRIVTVALGLVLGYGYYALLGSQGAVRNNNFFTAVIIILSFTAGSVIVMWLAERINENGIGNGISIILFVGIISRIPDSLIAIWANLQTGFLPWWLLILLVIGLVLIIAFVVLITNAERRIPVQYAKKVVGRKMYGGQSTHIPIKVNMTGVMPIIFASTMASIPATIAMFVPDPAPGSFWDTFLNVFSQDSLVYGAILFLLIFAFNYFYVSVQFNPVEIANNLRKNGGFVPGIRPGKPTSDFIKKILGKITFIGAIFLGIIAILPIILGLFHSATRLVSLGGTSLLIVVGVALETSKQLENQMLMRHYKGFLE